MTTDRHDEYVRNDNEHFADTATARLDAAGEGVSLWVHSASADRGLHTYWTPGQARRLAALLVSAADLADLDAAVR